MMLAGPVFLSARPGHGRQLRAPGTGLTQVMQRRGFSEALEREDAKQGYRIIGIHRCSWEGVVTTPASEVKRSAHSLHGPRC
jgi:hypothetical protein